jgi:hypothetical protein
MIAAILVGLATLFFVLLGILAFVFWIWMLVDCIRNHRLTSTQKIVWVLVILFLHDLGALIYFFAGRER